MKIEVGKLYRTRCGALAKIVAFEPEAEEIVGAYTGYLLDGGGKPVEVGAWHAYGRWTKEKGVVHDYDLMELPQPRLRAWRDRGSGVILILPEGSQMGEMYVRVPWLDESEAENAPPHAEDR